MASKIREKMELIEKWLSDAENVKKIDDHIMETNRIIEEIDRSMIISEDKLRIRFTI